LFLPLTYIGHLDAQNSAFARVFSSKITCSDVAKKTSFLLIEISGGKV